MRWHFYLTLLGDSVWLYDRDALVAGALLQAQLPGLLLDLLQVLGMPRLEIQIIEIYLLLASLLPPPA